MHQYAATKVSKNEDVALDFATAAQSEPDVTRSAIFLVSQVSDVSLDKRHGAVSRLGSTMLATVNDEIAVREARSGNNGGYDGWVFFAQRKL